MLLPLERVRDAIVFGIRDFFTKQRVFDASSACQAASTHRLLRRSAILALRPFACPWGHSSLEMDDGRKHRWSASSVPQPWHHRENDFHRVDCGELVERLWHKSASRWPALLQRISSLGAGPSS